MSAGLFSFWRLQRRIHVLGFCNERLSGVLSHGLRAPLKPAIAGLIFVCITLSLPFTHTDSGDYLRPVQKNQDNLSISSSANEQQCHLQPELHFGMEHNICLVPEMRSRVSCGGSGGMVHYSADINIAKSKECF